MRTSCCNATLIEDKYHNKYCEFCLRHNPSLVRKTNKWIVFGLAVLLLGVCFLLEAPNKPKMLSFDMVTFVNTDVPLNDSAIFNELLNQDVMFPEYALKSALYETGHWSSKICLEGNNIFGITYVNSKYQNGFITGKEGLRFGTYKSVKDCIRHYKIVQAKYGQNIDEKYSDNKNYTAYLQKINSKL